MRTKVPRLYTHIHAMCTRTSYILLEDEVNLYCVSLMQWAAVRVCVCVVYLYKMRAILSFSLLSSRSLLLLLSLSFRLHAHILRGYVFHAHFSSPVLFAHCAFAVWTFRLSICKCRCVCVCVGVLFLKSAYGHTMDVINVRVDYCVPIKYYLHVILWSGAPHN